MWSLKQRSGCSLNIRNSARHAAPAHHHHHHHHLCLQPGGVGRRKIIEGRAGIPLDLFWSWHRVGGGGGGVGGGGGGGIVGE